MRSRPTSYVGPVVVYVTHHFDKLYYEFMRDNAGTLGIQRIPDRVPTLSYWYYKIVGKFDILGCVRHHPSKWFTRRGHAYAYIIGNVELFPQPINVSKRFSQRRLPLFSEVIFDFQPVAIQRLHLDSAYK